MSSSVKGQLDLHVGGQGFSLLADSGIPCGRTADLQGVVEAGALTGSDVEDRLDGWTGEVSGGWDGDVGPRGVAHLSGAGGARARLVVRGWPVAAGVGGCGGVTVGSSGMVLAAPSAVSTIARMRMAGALNLGRSR